MKKLIVICLSLLMTACATTPPTRYIKKGATEEEFLDVAYQCKKKAITESTSEIRDAYGNVTPAVNKVNCKKFNGCLASKGYAKSPDGDFVVRDDKEIDCKE